MPIVVLFISSTRCKHLTRNSNSSSRRSTSEMPSKAASSSPLTTTLHVLKSALLACPWHCFWCKFARKECPFHNYYYDVTPTQPTNQPTTAGLRLAAVAAGPPTSVNTQPPPSWKLSTIFALICIADSWTLPLVAVFRQQTKCKEGTWTRDDKEFSPALHAAWQWMAAGAKRKLSLSSAFCSARLLD